MLLSLLKIIAFFAIVLAIALGAQHLSETGQMLQIRYGGTEIALTPVKAVAALLVLMVLAWLIFKILGLIVAVLRFLMGDETAVNRYFSRARERKGYAAFAEGMLAVASGEGKLAQDKAARAGRFLNQPHLTNLLAAQAAETAGDSKQAVGIYRQLLEDDRTRFVGIRGLMRQKLAEGDTHKALLLAQKAYALKPRHAEVQDTLLDLQTREHDWKGARKTLKDKRNQGQLPKAVALRRDAVLALKEASDVLAEGQSASAREAAISAATASPDLIPAAVLAARSYIEQKDYRNASRILEKTWSVRPHPDVAAAYAEIVPDEKSSARLRRFERLIAKNPQHEESRLLKAELMLAAENFPGARRALGDLAETHPTVRTLSIMAATERGSGADDAVVRGWLTKALTASRGPQWVCDKCHNVMPEWSPVCDSCGGFDTLTWREPDAARQTATASATGAEMLPLLVGSPRKDDLADAPDLSEPVQPHPPGPAEPEGQAPRAETVTPNVAPGMVPRESDYEVQGPSATVTDPEPVPEARPTDEPEPVQPETPAVETPERDMVRPDVQPADEADWSEPRKR
ncbi:heme biosynthesis HemY N-terminal domain-containing protein [Paracoccus sp. 1_MG-2023]|uniref:heme biosynthesis protein HemY n=1 Tax=unclassified Paracoccus (in: a-proteobacteria) TaxID=2688777 RepID=UPI001C0925F2|nr:MULTISPECIES: heme biosynthesis HemY N-terminal domain-containing protein [unclassified Paracoccus (in: a-proteobacteria)]MBU2957124.1 heme biosynthesis protein HemY [Paracoccus sp. C2R09]MDO6669542.1 heme biosynthesis HemY N-terminal domain-containing protein [Paracoccus sp. 1_MG-2023]